MFRHIRGLIVVVSLLAFSAGAFSCASTPQAEAEEPAVKEKPASDEGPTEKEAEAPSEANPSIEDLSGTLWIQSSAEYRALALQIYATAKLRLDQALEKPGWTASPEQSKSGDYQKKPPAVIVDVDETVLDNSAYQVRLIKKGEAFSSETWNAWCREESAPAVPGAVAFANYADEQGVTVFYVTNRDHVVEEATADNLKAVGFPVATDRDVVLTKNEKENWGSDKTPRRKHVAEEFRILLLVGDNLGDFTGETEVSSEQRNQKVEAYADRWGKSWLVLPNPVYGDWESTSFDYDWSLDHRKQRRRKLDTLDSRESGQTTGDSSE